MKKIIFLVFCIVLFSCSSSSVVEDQNVPLGFLKQVNSFGFGSSSTSNYYYVGNKISKIISNNGTSKYSYTGDLITKIQNYNSNSTLISKIEFQYNSNSTLNSALLLNYENNYGYKSEIIYNSDETATVNFYSGNITSQNTLNYIGLYHFANEEIISTELTSNSVTLISNYEYDSNNNPMNLIEGYKKLNILQYYGTSNLPFLFNGFNHNCIKVTNNDSNADCPTVKYILSYNSNNYPEFLGIDESSNSCSDLPSFQYIYQE